MPGIWDQHEDRLQVAGALCGAGAGRNGRRKPTAQEPRPRTGRRGDLRDHCAEKRPPALGSQKDPGTLPAQASWRDPERKQLQAGARTSRAHRSAQAAASGRKRPTGQRLEGERTQRGLERGLQRVVERRRRAAGRAPDRARRIQPHDPGAARLGRRAGSDRASLL